MGPGAPGSQMKNAMQLTTTIRCAALGSVITWVLVCAASAGTDSLLPPDDPHKVIKGETGMCRQCHSRSVKVWQETAHKTTFDELHLRKKARTVLENLGESGSIRRNERCVQCHYTLAISEANGQARAIAGVSCQRCHGGGADWVAVHHDTETIPDRGERLAKATGLGMHPTTDLYTLAAQCFECHTVPQEELVNRGHHATGSDFEFLDGMCGTLRHNFLDDDTQQRRERDTNHEVDAETQQLFYVLGTTLEMEFALRGLAGATTEGPYLTAMSERARKAFANLRELGGMDAILALVPTERGEVRVGLGNGSDYLAAADAIREIARTIEKNAEGFHTALSAAANRLPAR